MSITAASPAQGWRPGSGLCRPTHKAMFFQQFRCEGKRQRSYFVCLVLFFKNFLYFFKFLAHTNPWGEQARSLSIWFWAHLKIPTGIFHLAGLGSSLHSHS